MVPTLMQLAAQATQQAGLVNATGLATLPAELQTYLQTFQYIKEQADYDIPAANALVPECKAWLTAWEQMSGEEISDERAAQAAEEARALHDQLTALSHRVDQMVTWISAQNIPALASTLTTYEQLAKQMSIYGPSLLSIAELLEASVGAEVPADA